MFRNQFIPASLFQPKGQTRPNLHAMDGTAGRIGTAARVGRSPRARLQAELLSGR